MNQRDTMLLLLAIATIISLNLVLVVSMFGGTKTTEKATHSEEEGLDDGNV